MSKFIFALEPLLRVRRAEEESSQRLVADIQRERYTLEDRIRRKQQAITIGKSEQQNCLSGVLDMSMLRSHAGSTLRLMRDAQRIVLELAGLHKRQEVARDKLLEDTRRRRVVELLRENRFRRWKWTQEKIERDALDELAVNGAARKEKTR